MAIVVVAGLLACMPPSWGASSLLHPGRTPVKVNPALPHRDFEFTSDGVAIRGWIFPSAVEPLGVTVVYLHGVGDNRASGVWIAEQLVRQGFDVLAYDSRAHGTSGGSACTYGFYEKHDLSRALDVLGIRRAILVGASLGAAVALQAAAEEPRIIGVVAAATFSDLESIARDRVPFFVTARQIRAAVTLAEREAHFRVTAVSPVAAARNIRIPVLLVHGERDTETRPVHSERVYAALAGPKQLKIVPGAGHNDALGNAWGEVSAWISRAAEQRF
jgi:pimeloyl-ACP methyl ester carboxylesterase